MFQSPLLQALHISDRIVEQVRRKQKPFAGFLRTIMIIFAVILLLMGITISHFCLSNRFSAMRERPYQDIFLLVSSTFHQKDPGAVLFLPDFL